MFADGLRFLAGTDGPAAHMGTGLRPFRLSREHLVALCRVRRAHVLVQTGAGLRSRSISTKQGSRRLCSPRSLRCNEQCDEDKQQHHALFVTMCMVGRDTVVVGAPIAWLFPVLPCCPCPGPVPRSFKHSSFINHSRVGQRTAVLSIIPHCDCLNRVPNRPLRGVEADWELFCNSWSGGFLGEHL